MVFDARLEQALLLVVGQAGLQQLGELLAVQPRRPALARQLLVQPRLLQRHDLRGDISTALTIRAHTTEHTA